MNRVLSKIIRFFKRLFQKFWFGRRVVKPSELRAIAEEYFRVHPDAKDGVMKAWYAYHAPHFRAMPEMPLHNFTNGSRESECVWCGRSREMVRHDEQPPQCGNRPVIREIKDVLRVEEVRAFSLYNRARTEVPQFVKKMGMSGKTLAILHHTHGYDPETVSSIVEVPPRMMRDYYSTMGIEKVRSRNAQNKIVIK